MARNPPQQQQHRQQQQQQQCETRSHSPARLNAPPHDARWVSWSTEGLQRAGSRVATQHPTNRGALRKRLTCWVENRTRARSLAWHAAATATDSTEYGFEGRAELDENRGTAISTSPPHLASRTGQTSQPGPEIPARRRRSSTPSRAGKAARESNWPPAPRGDRSRQTVYSSIQRPAASSTTPAAANDSWPSPSPSVPVRVPVPRVSVPRRDDVSAVVRSPTAVIAGQAAKVTTRNSRPVGSRHTALPGKNRRRDLGGGQQQASRPWTQRRRLVAGRGQDVCGMECGRRR